MKSILRRFGVASALALFLGALFVSWLTHGTGVIKNDIARNIYVPDELTMPLQVMAAYNGKDMFFRYRGRPDSLRSTTTW